MYGIKGVDHLALPGLIDTVLAGSYPSGPSSLPMPKIWRMIVQNEIRAYNLPVGILFDMQRDAAAKRPGVLTKVGLDTFVDPDREGGAMNALAAERPVVRKISFEGGEWLYFRTIIPRVAIIRATTADERGNLSYEHEGAFLGALDLALAARNNGGITLAQVKRVVRAGSIPPQRVHVPCNLVDYIVVDEKQMQTTQTQYDPAISGEIFQPENSFALMPWSPEKPIARRVALELTAGSTANLGFGISVNVPRILLEEGLHGQVTWAIEQGAVGGMPLLDFGFGCASNADAIIPSPAQLTYFQGGGFDVALLSFLQIDREGNVNVSKLAAKPYLTSGCGGFVDITTNAKSLVFSGFFTAGAKLRAGDGCLAIEQEGKTKKLVNAVEQVTFSGRMARQRGQQVLYVTERCVLGLVEGGPEVVELAPGADLQRDVLALAEFPLKVSPRLKQMDAALYREAPMQLRLRAVPSERTALIIE
jgi:acyl CoA:acetate/3-ketoacid CoA transferase